MNPTNMQEDIEMTNMAVTSKESEINEKAVGTGEENEKNEKVAEETDEKNEKQATHAPKRKSFLKRIIPNFNKKRNEPQDDTTNANDDAQSSALINQNEPQDDTPNDEAERVTVIREQIEAHFRVVMPIYDILRDMEGRIMDERHYWHSIMVQLFAVFITILTIVAGLVIFVLPTIKMNRNGTKYD